MEVEGSQPAPVTAGARDMIPDAPLARQLEEIATDAVGPRIGAFFDLDGTLVSGFTATAHAGHRIRVGEAHIREVLGVVEASVRYRLGRMEFERLIVRAAGYLRGDSMAELDDLGELLFRERIEARVFAEMRDVVRAHQDRGHRVVLSSSALSMHVEPVARFLGIESVICNHFDVGEDGLLTGEVVEPIVWGARKAEAVARFAVANDVDLRCSYFYADGDEDAALMRVVGRPRPVNPRSGLAAEARRRGWPVLRFSADPPRPGPVAVLRRLAGRR
jgi:HAD superfamily hydrolase (TIGR01490 family)